MKLWIVTGGIATGKSQFCKCLQHRARPDELRLVSADEIVHQAYENPAVCMRIAEELGIVPRSEHCGTALRKTVRDRIRAAPELRKTLEAILHPIVWEQRQIIADRAKAEGIKVLVAEIPLYYETGTALAADQVIVVAASRGVQVSRLQSKRALDALASQDMLAMQMPLEQKIERADVVIWNDGSVSALENQAHLLLRQANLL